MNSKGVYTIKDLAQLTGVKAHTIRVWEKRYSIITPGRTDTNIRTYCDDDLKKLLNIAILNKNGIKISKIAQLNNQEIKSRVLKSSNSDYPAKNQIESLLLAMLDFDEVSFEKILNTSIIKHGFENTINEIILPFFIRIGLLWQIGTINPAQEHFVSNLFRQKLHVAIDGQVFKPAINFKTFVLFLPEGEYHELGLLYAYYLIKRAGHKVIYLGQSLPLADIAEVNKSVNFDYIFVSITSSIFSNGINTFFKRISELLPDKKIFANGYQIHINKNIIPSNIRIIGSYSDILDNL